MSLDYIDIPSDGNSLEEIVQQEELSHCIQRALNRMCPKEREVFPRYYFFLYNTDEISKCMGIPAGTVNSIMSRGRMF